MRHFIANLHKKPDHHKKRFALLASVTITMFIFGFWSIATFGVNGGVLASLVGNETEGSVQSGQVAAAVGAIPEETGPLASLKSGLGAGVSALIESVKELKNGLSPENFQSEYSELKGRAIETYGE